MYDHTRRTDEEWREWKAKKNASAKRRKSEGESKPGVSGPSPPPAADDVEDASEDGSENGDSDDAGDSLEALLKGKRRKEEREEAMRERVQSEMTARMDTGVRVNPALKKMFS